MVEQMKLQTYYFTTCIFGLGIKYPKHLPNSLLATYSQSSNTTFV